MKPLRLCVYILFVITLLGYVGLNLYAKETSDNTLPVITLPDDKPMEISISATEKELLADVKAFDLKDGDISDEIVVESISSFISEGVCEIVYAVSDSDCHVAKAMRLIRYTDYVPPRIYLRSPLVFSVGERVDFKHIVGAVDCIDGDISDRITFIATDYTSSVAGVYTLSIQVTSSRGDIIYMDFPVYVEQNSKLAPSIVLKENLIYLKKGENPDFASYVKEVRTGDTVREDLTAAYFVNFDTNKPGMYSVDYYVSGTDGNVGHTVLTVIVEE